jgi:hypothetical protein
MMKERKMDYRTADIQDGAVHLIAEQNFSSMSMPRKIRMVAPV